MFQTSYNISKYYSSKSMCHTHVRERKGGKPNDGVFLLLLSQSNVSFYVHTPLFFCVVSHTYSQVCAHIIFS
jgi:hypothetical protein